MRIIDAIPKDIYVRLEISLKELKMLQKYIESSMPFYDKVMEEYEERSFLENNFLPEVKSMLEHVAKFDK